MKNILFICFMLSCINSIAQDDPYMPQKHIEDTSKQTIMYSLNNKTDSLAYEIEHIRYNIGKFRNTMLTGFIFQAVGFGMSVISSTLWSIEYVEYNKQLDIYYSTVLAGNRAVIPDVPDYSGYRTVAIAGSVVYLIGSITRLSSYRFIKKASFIPTKYGVSFQYKF